MIYARPLFCSSLSSKKQYVIPVIHQKTLGVCLDRARIIARIVQLRLADESRVKIEWLGLI